MTLHESIALPNGLRLEIWDCSRPIASDTFKVEMVAQAEVEFLPAYFSEKARYDKLIKTLGKKGLYEFRKVRSFVKERERNGVFQELLAAFKEHTLPYVSLDEFPRRFSRAKFRDIEQNWYQYVPPDDEG
jgi:hypothetical protein